MIGSDGAQSLVLGVLSGHLDARGPADVAPARGSDLWWLDWAGRQVLDGRLPAENGLSWADPDVPWVCHEWLVATLYAALGLDGVVHARAFVVSSIAVTLGILAYRPRSAWATILALVGALPLVSIATSERAMAWGLALAGAQLVLLKGGEERWRGFAAALVVGLWANVHGSFPVGILTLLVCAPPGRPSARRSRSPTRTASTSGGWSSTTRSEKASSASRPRTSRSGDRWG